MVYRKVESFVNVFDILSDLFIHLTLLYQINLQHGQTMDLFWYEMKPLYVSYVIHVYVIEKFSERISRFCIVTSLCHWQ